MPKIRYNETKLIKKRGKIVVFAKMLVFLLTIAGMGLFFSDVFSGVLVDGGFTVFANADSISNKPSTLYVLTLGEYEDVQSAEKVANVAGSWGAGAYIANLNGKYQVVGCIYSSREDSENVRTNLGQTNYNTQTIEITFDKIKFTIKDIEKESKKNIMDALNAFSQTYSSLYDVTMKVDKGEITNIVASGQVNTIKSDVRVCRMNLAAVNLKYNMSVLSKLNDALIKLEEGLDVCVNQLLANSYINHSVKYCLCDCVFLQHNFYNNL